MVGDRHLYRLLAEMLEYPRPGLEWKAREGGELVGERWPQTAVMLADFAGFAESTPLGRLEELYTATFDLNPHCCPYLGHQLFGENPKRTQLMLQLRESYRTVGFDPGSELADHVAVVLRFLAEQADPELEHELVALVLLPALEKMSSSLAEKNPYAMAIRAAATVLKNHGDTEITEISP